ncbi:AAA family ATPase [Macrococcoides caseolyticum]|nr:AAA family ATPase [Macrococcus caseolyticus]MBQ5152537.1 recombination protein RecF [Macrococcus caseolyticus]RAI80813.1 recombination protein RecF [Macrococcus caseolyticus subsp. hominis]RKO15507.1 recombination protein RecF [Macrococcus caseolyticus]
MSQINNEIIKWIKDQPYWMKMIADSCLKNTDIDDVLLDEIYMKFKIENKLMSGSIDNEDIKFISKVEKEDNNRIKWDSVSEVQGVNALHSKSKLIIGKQLTLIYGENGSGKSSYTRLFNNVFVSRGDTKITKNIYDNDNTELSATFKFYDEKNNEIRIKYPGDNKNSIFDYVYVFDTTSAMKDVTKENEISFVPLELNFFDSFLHYYIKIKQKLDQEINEKNIEFDFIKLFNNDNNVKSAVKNINENTDFNQLIIMANTSFLEDKFKTLSDRKKDIQSMDISGKIKFYSRIKIDLENLKNELKDQMIILDKLQLIKKMIDDINHLNKLSKTSGVDIFQEYQISKIESEEWKNFIIAAKEYYDSLNKNLETCIFCGQIIEDNDLIEKYWTFLDSTAEMNLSVAKSKLNTVRNEIEKNNNVILTKKSVLEEWLQEYYAEAYNKIRNTEELIKNLKNVLIVNIENLSWDLNMNDYELEDNDNFINNIINELDVKISKLKTNNFEDELIEINKFIDEYNDRLQLKKILYNIDIYIKNLKWKSKAKSINLSTRSITNFQNKLFSDFVSKKYISNFDEECNKLDANFSAEILQRGKTGATLSKLSIKGNRPVDILSEGEQRSIAIANFLAETNTFEKNFCVIFDDPVSSLDHKRRDIIAKRLVEESKNRQVVILTHDITFFTSLIDYSEKENIECDISTIRKFNNESGILMKGDTPWETKRVKERIKYLKNELQSITTFYSSITNDKIDEIDKYKNKAKLWCELLRETWERTIEQILFNDAVQRFNPSIQTQRLKKAKFTTELYKEIEQEMSNCSKWVHDRASNLGEDFPKPDTLKIYLENCESFIKVNNPDK